MLVVHAKCTAQLHAICRVECEMSGRGNWWVRSMELTETAHARRLGSQARGGYSPAVRAPV